GHLYPVADPAHVDLGGRGALAGMEALGGQNHVELAVHFDDIALAEGRSDDFHERGSSIGVRRQLFQILGCMGILQSRCATYRSCAASRAVFAPSGWPAGARMTQRQALWNSERHADRRPFLVERGAIVKALRAYFAECDFLEVETSTLQVSGGNECHIHALG